MASESFQGEDHFNDVPHDLVVEAIDRIKQVLNGDFRKLKKDNISEVFIQLELICGEYNKLKDNTRKLEDALKVSKMTQNNDCVLKPPLSYAAVASTSAVTVSKSAKQNVDPLCTLRITPGNSNDSLTSSESTKQLI